MQTRVEIKARVANLHSFLINAKHISGREGEVSRQMDTFFNCPNGKLKIRNLQGVDQLIFYRRTNGNGPKVAQFHYVNLSNSDEIKNTLDLAYGTKGKVSKTRTTFLTDERTRIHADDVEGLGTFMELEVQMKEGENVHECQKIVEDLMIRLGVSKDDLVTGSYLDHILMKVEQSDNTQ